jgi:hypothetical protein
VKFVLTILCGLLFLGGQMAAVALPMGCASQTTTAQPCACGGKMACCAAKKTADSQPLSATVPVTQQNQILTPVPAMMVWILATTEIPSSSPTATVSSKAGDAPIFARHCAWLI